MPTIICIGIYHGVILYTMENASTHEEKKYYSNGFLINLAIVTAAIAGILMKSQDISNTKDSKNNTAIQSSEDDSLLHQAGDVLLSLD